MRAGAPSARLIVRCSCFAQSSPCCMSASVRYRSTTGSTCSLNCTLSSYRRWWPPTARRGPSRCGAPRCRGTPRAARSRGRRLPSSCRAARRRGRAAGRRPRRGRAPSLAAGRSGAPPSADAHHSGSSTAISGTAATETTRGSVSDGTGVTAVVALVALEVEAAPERGGRRRRIGRLVELHALPRSSGRSPACVCGTLYWLRRRAASAERPPRILSIASMIASLVARNSLNIGRARYVRCSPSLSVTTR